MEIQIKFELLNEETKKRTELKNGDTLYVMRNNGTIGFLRKGTRLLNDRGDDKILADGNSVIALLRHFGVYVDKCLETNGSECYRITI